MEIEYAHAAESRTRFSRIRHWPLLLVIIFTLAASPVAYQILGLTGAWALGILLYATGAFFVARSTRILVVCSIIGLTAASLHAAITLGGNRDTLLSIGFHSAAIGFFVIIGINVLQSLLCTTKVTGDTILGGVTAYLLLGILFAFLYSLIETVHPGSFTLPAFMTESSDAMNWLPTTPGAAETPGPSPGNLNLIYFSFTTMSTLGYGDITPRLPLARSLSSTQAVLGQLFMAILIARLVSVAKLRHDPNDSL